MSQAVSTPNVPHAVTGLSGGSVEVVGSTDNAKLTYHSCAVRQTFDTSASVTIPIVTLHHLVTATKKLELVFLELSVVSNSVIGLYDFRLQRFTGAPTGGTTQAAIPASGADAAAESVFTRLPTAAGTLVGDLDVTSYKLGVIANQVGAPFVNEASFTYLPANIAKPPTLRAGVAEGFVVGISSDSASTQTWTLNLVYTEE